MKQIATLIIACVISLTVSAQTTTSSEPNKLTLSAGAGVFSFFGEMNQDQDVSTFTNMRTGFHFGVDRRFGNWFSIGLDGKFGTVAHTQRSPEIALNRNFESKITQFGINATFHFDNDAIIERSSMFTPYISAGFGFLMFDAYGDTKDANGNDYYYWTDGSIRDRSQMADDADSAVLLVRDYTYETQLRDSTTNYDRSTFAIPLTLGFQWKFSDHVEGRFFTSYNLTMSDYIDNYSDDAKNDAYLYTGFSIAYNIRNKNATKQAEKEKFKEVDFASLTKADADGDGVSDFDDECPDTPKGLKVTNKGCPMDDDKDGVPNHLDREPNTVKGMPVDEYGITVDDQYLERQRLARDSVATVRTQAFAENPNSETLLKFDRSLLKNKGAGQEGSQDSNASSKIPAEFREADLNNDGIIQSTEITATIDGFFEGTNNFTVAGIQDLIDYFFEQ